MNQGSYRNVPTPFQPQSSFRPGTLQGHPHFYMGEVAGILGKGQADRGRASPVAKGRRLAVGIRMAPEVLEALAWLSGAPSKLATASPRRTSWSTPSLSQLDLH